jgi:glycosyltransferase involved in cell wall biosynthesis
MRIALLMPIGHARGGAERLFQHLLDELPDSSLDAHVVLFEEGDIADTGRAAGLPLTVLPTGRLRQVRSVVHVVKSLTDFLNASDIDLVVSWMTKAHLYGGPAARRAGVPAVWYQHGVPDRFDLVTRLATLLPAEGILACSEPIRNAQALLTPRRPVHTVEPCVDLDRFDPALLPSPSKARRELNLPEKGPLFGIFGRMQAWKGIHVFVEAMARVREIEPSAHGVIVGGEHPMEPGYTARIDRQIRRLELDGHVRRVGFQSNIPTWMQAMDVIVHASDYEPFGMVIIEAMAIGKPVIAGAEGGPATIISDGVNGLLSPYGDAVALAERMISLVRERSRADAIAAAAQQRARDFSQSAFLRRFENALYAILPAPRRSPVAPPVSV